MVMIRPSYNISTFELNVLQREQKNEGPSPMKVNEIVPVFTSAEMRRIDTYTIEKSKVPGRELMGRAGEAVLCELTKRFPLKSTYFLVWCGLGNNGGDGFAFALRCWKSGYRNFKIFILTNEADKRPTADASFYLNELIACGVKPQVLTDASFILNEKFAVKIDALFGTGLDRELDEFYRNAIGQFNQIDGFTIAVDCPSGLNATTGEIEGACVKADLTVTMGYPKSGFFTAQGKEQVGELAVYDIGLRNYEDVGLHPSTFYFPPEFFQVNAIPSRRSSVHKGDFGKVMVVAGSKGFSGAAKMVSRSALRAGAGLVRLFVPFEIFEVVASELTEVMVDSFLPFGFSESSEGLEKLEPHLHWADVLALGSGLSERYELQETAHSIVRSSTLPFIADAEGTIAAKRWLEEVGTNHGRVCLLTPHLGELARLCGRHLAEVKDNPTALALELSTNLNCYILAKSSTSFLATPTGMVLYPPAGHPVLAKGGSGDVLVGSLAARCAISLKASESGETPYEGEYLTDSYYSKFPPEIRESLSAAIGSGQQCARSVGRHLAWIEGILRGYYLFADASRFATEFYGDEEAVLSGEISDLIDAGVDSVEAEE